METVSLFPTESLKVIAERISDKNVGLGDKIQLFSIISKCCQKLSDIEVTIDSGESKTEVHADSDFWDDELTESKQRFEPSEVTIFKPMSLEKLSGSQAPTVSSKILEVSKEIYFIVSSVEVPRELIAYKLKALS